MHIQTRLIHAGEEQKIAGAVVTPIFQSATFTSEEGQGYDDIRYLRLNNTPNHNVLHAKLADICGGEAALVTGSGMAAITTAKFFGPEIGPPLPPAPHGVSDAVGSAITVFVARAVIRSRASGGILFPVFALFATRSSNRAMLWVISSGEMSTVFMITLILQINF